MVDEGLRSDNAAGSGGNQAVKDGYAIFKKGQVAGGRMAQEKIISAGSLASDYGFSGWLGAQPKVTQTIYGHMKGRDVVQSQFLGARKKKWVPSINHLIVLH